MSDIASLNIKINSSQARTAQNDLNRLQRQGSTAERGMQSMTRTAARLGTALAAAFSVYKIQAEIRKSVQLYANLERSQLRLTRQIELMGHQSIITAEEIEKMASRIDRATLMSAEGVRRAASMILTSEKITRESFERTMAVAVDMAEVFELDMATAARYLTRAIGDTTGAMTMFRRYGLELEESVQGQIKALQEAGRETEAYGLLLDALEGRVKGAAEAAGKGLAGAFDDASRASRELREEIGRRLDPQVRAMVETIVDFLDDHADDFVNFFGRLVSAVDSSLQKLSELVKFLQLVYDHGGLINYMRLDDEYKAMPYDEYQIVEVKKELQDLYETFNRMREALRSQDLAPEFRSAMLDELRQVGQEIHDTELKIYRMEMALEKTEETTKKTSDAVTNLGLEFEKTGDKAGGAAEELTEAEKAFNKVRDSLKDQIKQVQLGEKEYARYSMLLEAGIDISGALTKAEKERFAVLMKLWATLQDVTKAQEDMAAAQEYANEKAEAMVEIENLLANTMREINQLRGQGVDDIELQIWALMDLAIAYDLEYKAIEEVHQALLDLRKAREEAAKRPPDPTPGYRKQATEIERIYGRMLESMRSNTASTFRRMLDDGLDKWRSWKDGAIDIVKDTLAQIAALFAQQRIILPVTMSMVGGMGMGGTAFGQTVDAAHQAGGGFGLPGGGAMNWAQNNIPGMGWLGATMPGTMTNAMGGAGTSGMVFGSGHGAMVGAGSGLSAGAMLGAGAISSLGYSMLGPSLGLPQNQYTGITSGIGGALGMWGGSALTAGATSGVLAGATAGSVVPVIGTAIGAIAGGLLGGMLGGSGKKPRPKGEIWFPGFGVGIDEARTKSKDKGGKVIKPIGEETFGHMDEWHSALDTLGGSLDDFFLKLEYIGHRGGEHSIWTGFEDYRTRFQVKEFEDLPWDEITALIFEEMVKAAEFESEQMADVIDNINFDSIEEAMADLEFAFGFDDTIAALSSGIEEMRQQIDAAAQQEVAQLTASLEQQMETTERLGLDTDALTSAQMDYVKSLVLGRETMSEAEAQMYSLEARFREYEKLLVEVGYSAEEAARIAADGWKRATDEIQSMMIKSIAQMQAQVTGHQEYLAPYYQETYGFVPDAQQTKAVWDAFIQASPEQIEQYAADIGVDPQTFMRDLKTAYDFYYPPLTDAVNRNTTAVNNQSDLLRAQEQHVRSQIQHYTTLQNLIDSIMGGRHASVQSAEWFDRRYNELLDAAKENPELIGEFTDFASQYLDFHNAFGGGLDVTQDVLQDLYDLQAEVSGGASLSDLYQELQRITAQLEFMSTVSDGTTGGGGTSGGTRPSSGGGGDIESIKNRAYERTIKPIIDATHLSSVDELESTYKDLKGTPIWSQTVADAAEALGITSMALTRDLQQYYGFQHGGTIEGPMSGYTVPTTFHGKEHITPDNDMQDVKRLLQALVAQNGGGDVTVKVYVGDREITDLTAEAIRTDPNTQQQVRRVARV